MSVVAEKLAVNVNAADIIALRAELSGRSGRLTIQNTGANALAAGSRIRTGPGDGYGAKAALTTALAGTHNDLVFTAVKGGTPGNSIRVRYVDPAAASQPLKIDVLALDITLTLATNGASAITTTAADIIAILRQSELARALVDVALAAANDGTGVVIALAFTALIAGTDQLADFDLVTIASLAAGASKTVAIPGPGGLVVVECDQGAGATTVNVWLEAQDW